MCPPSLLHPLGERKTCQRREVIVRIHEAINKQLRIEVKQSTADLCELRDRNCKNMIDEK
jgi:hypothetical protein